MNKTRFTESQIVAFLQKAEKGQKIADLCRELGISEGTVFRLEMIDALIQRHLLMRSDHFLVHKRGLTGDSLIELVPINR
jgi:predicted DNA-binding transcriptional regulator